MNNKGTGAMFCLMAAILMAARYVAAACYMGGLVSQSEELYSVGLEIVGGPLKTASLIALAIGIIFLVCGILQDLRKKPE